MAGSEGNLKLEILSLVDFLGVNSTLNRSKTVPFFNILHLDNNFVFNFHTPSMNGAKGTSKS
jgi:hypothetical protein